MVKRRLVSPGTIMTKTDRDFLFDKLFKSGLTTAESNARISKFRTYVKNTVDKMKQDNKPQEDINEVFTMEYEKLLMEAETGRFG